MKSRKYLVSAYVQEIIWITKGEIYLSHLYFIFVAFILDFSRFPLDYSIAYTVINLNSLYIFTWVYTNGMLIVSYCDIVPHIPRNLLSSSMRVFTAKSSRIRPSFRARVTILEAQTIGNQCLLGFGNFVFKLWNIDNSFSNSKPLSTKCSGVGNLFFTRGATFVRTIVKQTHTYLRK